MARILVVCVAFVVAAWHLSPPVHAYLDPGTGSALLQGIIGALAVASGVIAYQWRRIRTLFSGRDSESRTDHSNE